LRQERAIAGSNGLQDGFCRVRPLLDFSHAHVEVVSARHGAVREETTLDRDR
jgi:hypothetical protein